MPLAPDVELLAADWFRRARESQRAHYERGKWCQNMNRALGMPTIALSVVVGTKVFSDIDQHADSRTKLILGLLSVLAAVLASLQTFMSFAELAARHKVTGAKYGSIRRDLELLKIFPPPSEQEIKQELIRIKREMDGLAEGSPPIPSRLKARVDKELKSEAHRRIFDLPAPN